MLAYTGHPFIDVGVAAIAAFAGKRRPEEVTAGDLYRVADYVEDHYTVPPLSSFLIVSLMNSGFTQPAFDQDRKRAYARLVTRSFGSDVPKSDELCVFTGQPATGVPLSLKDGPDQLPPGRIFRQHLPLSMGEGVINFSPNGDPGLPVSGLTLLCLQFFPMGCAKCGLGLLAVHAEDDELTYGITRQFLNQNLRAVTQAEVAHETKLPAYQRSTKTLLIEALLEADRERTAAATAIGKTSLTAYNFNGGKSADLRIHHVPHEIIGFVRTAQTSTYQEGWDQLVRRGWQLTRARKGGDGSAEEGQPRYNYLYEDLFSLPATAPRFIRTYFLRIPRRTRQPDDPRNTYSLRAELDLVSWQLVELFLRKVVLVNEQRMARIRALGDQLAEYTKREGGKRFFRAFSTENNAANFRNRLIRANLDAIRAGLPQLFDLDTYVEVFVEDDEVMRPDWRFARDLVLMRMIDQLKAWLTQNRDAIPDIELGEEEAKLADVRS